MNQADAARLDWMEVDVAEVKRSGDSTLVLTLTAPQLAAYPPGAHVAVQCGEVVRHYSLCTSGRAPAAYVLGVKIDAASRGGSRWIEAHAVAGAKLRISTPRNHFPLREGESAYLFLSGGIGVTPILAMLEHLRDIGVRARHVHLCRSRAELAFAERLAALAPFHDIRIHCDDEAGRMFDLDALLRAADPATAVYCCGPGGMMQAVQEIGATLDRAERYHFEFFSPPEAADTPAGDDEFVVIQHSTGRRIPVSKNKTMLAALREAGLQMKSECEYGVCGWCAVGVVEGEPKHFDSYLTEAERQAGRMVLPCVSRCASATITLEV
jgi:vanillate O-demethylase ferredoxin subunit